MTTRYRRQHAWDDPKSVLLDPRAQTVGAASRTRARSPDAAHPHRSPRRFHESEIPIADRRSRDRSHENDRSPRSRVRWKSRHQAPPTAMHSASRQSGENTPSNDRHPPALSIATSPSRTETTRPLARRQPPGPGPLPDRRRSSEGWSRRDSATRWPATACQASPTIRRCPVRQPCRSYKPAPGRGSNRVVLRAGTVAVRHPAPPTPARTTRSTTRLSTRSTCPAPRQ